MIAALPLIAAQSGIADERLGRFDPSSARS
jgi:hypothetical protein